MLLSTFNTTTRDAQTLTNHNDSRPKAHSLLLFLLYITDGSFTVPPLNNHILSIICL